MPGIIKQFLQFVREEKKWIILPLVILVLLLGVIAFFISGGSGISWALYPSR